MARAPSSRAPKPSEYSVFLATVFTASFTQMEFPDFVDLYDEQLKVIFFNHDVDLPLLIDAAASMAVKPTKGAN